MFDWISWKLAEQFLKQLPMLLDYAVLFWQCCQPLRYAVLSEVGKTQKKTVTKKEEIKRITTVKAHRRCVWRIMYNRSLVFSTVWFGLCSIILLCSTRLTWYHERVLCVYLVDELCICFLFVFSLFQEVWTIYKGSTHSGYHFFRRRDCIITFAFILISWFAFWFYYKAKSETNFILELLFLFVWGRVVRYLTLWNGWF